MVRFTWAMVLAVSVGCGGDSAGDAGDGGDGPDPGEGCDLPASGSGSASVSAGAETELASRSTAAQNTLAIEGESGLHPQRLHALAMHPSGGAAIVRADLDGDVLEYVHADATEQARETITTGRGPASLLFDDAGAPLVLTGGGAAYREFTRTGADTWEERVAVDLTVSFPGEGFNGITHVAADEGRDGRLHVFGHVGEFDRPTLLHGVRDTAAGSEWSFDTVTLPGATSVWDYAADSSGRVHLAYAKTAFPCDPCDVGLYHAVQDGAGGFTETTVHEGRFSNSGDELSQFATLAVDASDQPWIAAQLQSRVVTGSLTSASAVLWAPVSGSDEFCGEVLASQSDGYAGSDGTSFTGGEPVVAVDDAGRVHVLFADVAAWHDGTGSNVVQGQMRYAVRTGTDVTVSTLRAQNGQTVSPTPIQGAVALGLVVGPDGSGAIAGAEYAWETNSIYNDSEVPLSVRSFVQALSF